MSTTIHNPVAGSSGGSSSGTVVIQSALQGTLQTRTEIIADLVRHPITFDPPIQGMSIKVRHADSTGITADQGILITVDAVDDGIADDNLDETQVGVRINLMPDDAFQELVFEGALVSRIDLKGVGDSPDLIVTLGGVY